MAEKNSFVLYDNYKTQVEMLTDEQAGRLFKAIFAYRYGEAREMDDLAVSLLLSVITEQIDRDTKKYFDVCEKRKAAGSLGGRPSKANGNSQKAKKQMVFWKSKQKAKKADNDNENDNGNESENDNENENDSESEKTIPSTTRHRYGEYQNVLLSDDDMTKLKAEFPNDWQARIDRLSEYIATSGKSYKNHLATIRAWARRDKEDAPQQRRQQKKAPKENFESQERDLNWLIQ